MYSSTFPLKSKVYNQTDVKNMLRIPSCIVFRSSFNRTNLHYEVRPKFADANEVIDDVSLVWHNLYVKAI